MLYDRATIHVEAGRGGDGAVSFRREAHVPKGGPDGGDGGRGGDVVLVCDPSLRDLQRFGRQRHFRAGGGSGGEGSNRHGADGGDLELAVPPGTVATEVERGLRFDLAAPGQRAVVAGGGSGGRGNKRFAGPRRQAPRFAERGLPGVQATLELRLKLLADAGLVGLPNAGKSSLLSRLTAARPKIADYPFTTLEPALGTIEADDRQVVVADIPGLIEGARSGAGLGHDFLAHVERTRVLVHVVELAPADGSDPAANHTAVEQEIAGYAAALADLPRIVCLSKADLLPAEVVEHAAADWRARLGDAALEVLATSAATGAGIDELARAIVAAVPVEGPGAATAEEPDRAEHRVYRPGADDSFRVEPLDAGGFRIVGGRVERLVGRHDLGNPDALRYIEDSLRAMGAIRALEAAGFRPGDDVEIAGVVFELDPGGPSRPDS
jgi:GTP-binding protein